MTRSNGDWDSQENQELDEIDVPTIVLTDDNGRTLTCYVERSLEVEEQEYVLLLPVDSPVEIFSWEPTEDDDDEEAVLVEDESVIDQIFSVAKAVLEEQNLVLKRTALVLTVEGDIPELDEDEDAEFSGLDSLEDEQEEMQLLANFFFEEQEYAVYTPLDPFFILARLDDEGKPQLLSQEEMEKIEPLLPMIEDQLFDDLD